MIRDAMAVELAYGQMVIVSAYGRGATALPASAALLTILGGSGKVTVGVSAREIIELIAVLTQQSDHLSRGADIMHERALADHKESVRQAMAKHDTVEGRALAFLDSQIAVAEGLVADLKAHKSDIAKGIAHGVK